ncbi:type IV toxin-antitoxin system AbiEi family antitoxin domain-containing protein [Kribbella sp.]|uniref:type IV toxin-antitoxin system AbiEi family antitoxin domain-containing protein n=1 Tax=Kribbella sp. TaxID=1871183 RepID=UPI002D5BECC4|nr:type IV toxin-antitoxin system AbiEi family antitoxin domain-containing protein [Kribbella sp.]HZX08316.1 type IV toxin-antitoxin system AbiEi family antitoxin domain-containing protein [Kribbella sp.]
MNPQLAVMASIRGGVFTRADARACGYADSDIDALLRSGQWRRIRRGTYAARRSLMLVTDEILHLRRTYRVLRSGGPDVFASHQSAAALHALPVWGLDLTRVHITAPDGRSGRFRGVHRHIRDPVGPGLQLWNTLQMVSPARAIVEVAATAPSVPAVVLADAALYTGTVDRRALDQAITFLDHGNNRALKVLDQITGAASIAESRLRHILADAGLPTPSPAPPPDTDQPDPDDPAAEALWFPDERTVVEFEPRFPFYTEDPDPEDQTTPPANSDGPQPVEHCWISWTDLNDPATVADRIRTTFTRAARRTGIRHFDLARVR